VYTLREGSADWLPIHDGDGARGERARFSGTDIFTLSAMGMDSVTAMGARNLSLVAGGVAEIHLQTFNGEVDLVRDPIIAQMMLPEPGAPARLIVAVAGLLAIAALRAARTRRSN
jgi:hypothetical protein